MENQRDKNQQDPGQRNAGRLEQNSSTPNDLPDSQNDRERLEPEETYIDLPDVKDIPGQEFVHAPPLGMMGDTTISSADEEGEGIFEEEDDEELVSNEISIGRDERETLEKTDYLPTRDADSLERAAMDNRDFEGTSLNEAGFGHERSGRDLDIPGSELDDRDENIG